MSEKKSQAILKAFQSPVTAYEIALAEIERSENPKDQKITKVFDILDGLIPNLGVYCQLMKMVRQQLFDAVFSDAFTGSNDKQVTTNASTIQRMSYYSLYKQIRDTRDDKIEYYKSELGKTQESLKDTERELSDTRKKLAETTTELEEARSQINQLQNDLAKKSKDMENLEKRMKKMENSYKQQCEHLESTIAAQQADINRQNKEIKDLMVYKNGYDEIQKNFLTVIKEFEPSISDEFSKNRKKQVFMNRRNQVTSDIVNAKKIEEQILTLMNISTEEYDKFYEKHQKLVVEKLANASETESNEDSILMNSTSSMSRYDSDFKSRKLSDVERKMLNHELNKYKTSYKQSINELKYEYDLIVQHRQSLEEKLYLYEVDRETAEFVRRQRAKAAPQPASSTASSNNLTDRKANSKTGEEETNDGNILKGLEEHYEPIRRGADRDQFTTQDRVLSKWSCLLHTSTNGAIWNDCKQIKYCENCGDKTLICPHKLTSNDAIIQVPPGTLFLKFSRPKLHYNQFLVKRALDAFKKFELKLPDNDIQNGQHTSVMTNYKAKYTSDPNPNNLSKNAYSIKLLNEGDADIGFPHHIERIWFDFNQRTNYKREVSRPFSYERTISMFQQFLAFLHNKELNRDYEDPMDLMNTVYEYFGYRYELEEIKFSAIFDFFASIIAYSSRSKILEVFCHVLIGNLDRGILNYLLYLAEIIDKIEWIYVDDVKFFFAIVYPFCDDDDLDNLTLEYTSYSENKINKKLIWEFVVSLVMKRREPLVNEMHFRLSSQTTKHEHLMTEQEYCNAIEEFFYIYDERMTTYAYRTALASANLDGYENITPTFKLAHPTAYFCLIQIIYNLKESINKLVVESRKKLAEEEAKEGAPVVERPSNLVDYQDEFLRLSDIDKLASTYGNDHLN